MRKEGGDGVFLLNVTSHNHDLLAGKKASFSHHIVNMLNRFKCAVFRRKINPFEAVQVNQKDIKF